MLNLPARNYGLTGKKTVVAEMKHSPLLLFVLESDMKPLTTPAELFTYQRRRTMAALAASRCECGLR